MDSAAHIEETMKKSIKTIAREAYNMCYSCGQCIPKCFLSESYPDLNPRKIVQGVVQGRAEELADSEFIWACTLCGRCAVECPKGVDIGALIRGIRGIALRKGKAPARIVEGIKKSIEFGNNTGMEGEDFVETVEWLAEELAEDLEDIPEEKLELPVDKVGAEVLYIPNPREYISNPEMFQNYLKYFVYSETDWTLSSKVFDITNWPYYMGDHETAVLLLKNMVDEVRRLDAKILLSTECGHGFKILRKDAENWLGEPLGFEVLSIVELAHQQMLEGRLDLAPHSIEGRVTYHDPCNVGRQLGVYDPPRELLKHIAQDYVELWPSKKHNLCCGGGGSVGQNTDMAKKRLEHAQRKRDQILRTGATILSTSCQNCLSQLHDLQARYEMPLEVKSVMELVVQALEAHRNH